MGLLSSMIVTVCMGTQGQYRSACNSALSAGTQQSGISQDFDRAEKNGSLWADHFADDSLGRDGKNLTGGMLFLVKSIGDRAIVIPIPTGGFADHIQSQFKPNSATISFKWTF